MKKKEKRQSGRKTDRMRQNIEAAKELGMIPTQQPKAEAKTEKDSKPSVSIDVVTLKKKK